MFKNYYLFKKQIEEIQPLIKNSIIFSIFTVHKNELIIDLFLELLELKMQTVRTS